VYPCVSSDENKKNEIGIIDAANILRKYLLVNEILKLNFVLSGGAILDIIDGRPVSDLDFYYYCPTNEELYQQVLKVWKLFEIEKKSNTLSEFGEMYVIKGENFVYEFSRYSDRAQHVGSVDFGPTLIFVTSENIEVHPIAEENIKFRRIIVNESRLNEKRYCQRLMLYFNIKKYGLLFPHNFDYAKYGLNFLNFQPIFLNFGYAATTLIFVTDDNRVLPEKRTIYHNTFYD
jgi:hypothetical protein